MLVRRAIVWLVIGTVVACPFPCLAEAAQGSASDATVLRNQCGCCGPVQPTEPMPRPSSQGGTCLCHGAVLEHVAQVPGLDLQPVAVYWFDVALQIVSPATIELGDLNLSACDFANADSGRTIRALIESFLI